MSSVVDWIHENRERERKKEKISLFFFSSDFFSSDRDGTCWDDEKTSRQWLWWIRAQQADAGILPFVVSAWMHLFSSTISHLFWLPDYLCLYRSLEDNQYFNCLFSAGYGTEEENRCRIETEWCSSFSPWSITSWKSSVYVHIHHSIHLNMWIVCICIEIKVKKSELYDTSRYTFKIARWQSHTYKENSDMKQNDIRISSMTQFFSFSCSSNSKSLLLFSLRIIELLFLFKFAFNLLMASHMIS